MDPILDTIIDKVGKLFYTDEGKDMLKKLITECTYDINLKKESDNSEAHVILSLTIKCPAPGEKLLFLLT